eukprot:scaffold167381_cov32-Tisochrysis_lutea.AAC.5
MEGSGLAGKKSGCSGGQSRSNSGITAFPQACRGNRDAGAQCREGARPRAAQPPHSTMAYKRRQRSLFSQARQDGALSCKRRWARCVAQHCGKLVYLCCDAIEPCLLFQARKSPLVQAMLGIAIVAYVPARQLSGEWCNCIRKRSASGQRSCDD